MREITSVCLSGMLILVIAACSANLPTPPSISAPIAQSSPTAQEPSPSASPSQSAAATSNPFPNATPTAAVVADLSPTLVAPTATATAGDTPQTGNQVSSNPTVMSSAGLKTYVNTGWHLALDYPADWSVREQGNLVTFLSPTGATIQLSQAAAGSPVSPGVEPNEDLPNTRCKSQTNAHGISERVCFDTIAFSTSAVFAVKSAEGAASLLELSTGRRTGDVSVLNAMLETVRSTG